MPLFPVVAEYVPAGQSTHDAFPVCPLNLPAAHAEHEAPVYPALHEQALLEVLPCGEPALLGQLVQFPWPFVCVCVCLCVISKSVGADI